MLIRPKEGARLEKIRINPTSAWKQRKQTHVTKIKMKAQKQAQTSNGNRQKGKILDLKHGLFSLLVKNVK